MSSRLIVTGFQSALPLRGATALGERARTPFVISIRAPLAGSDLHRAGRLSGKDRHFNPRSPCGERHEFLVDESEFIEFQSALPLRGATPAKHPCLPKIYFNPRSPCGERPLHFVASIYYQQSVVFSKTVTANSVDKLRKTTAKSAITRCEPHS